LLQLNDLNLLHFLDQFGEAIEVGAACDRNSAPRSRSLILPPGAFAAEARSHIAVIPD
jgi:hypothetical protein